jgi:hypothetical protein
MVETMGSTHKGSCGKYGKQISPLQYGRVLYSKENKKY